MLSMIIREKTPLEERGKEREKPFVITIMKHLHSSLAIFFYATGVSDAWSCSLWSVISLPSQEERVQ